MTACAIYHVPFEDLGLLSAVLTERAMSVEMHPAWDIPQSAAVAPLLVLLGGPMSVNDTDDYPFLEEEIALARVRLAAGLPTLGICLGAQIMTRAIGGTVGPGPEKELGWAEIELTDAGCQSALRALEGVSVLHWHGEVCALPPGTRSLATTPACKSQAFAPAPRALALQFHAEAGHDGIESWLAGHSVEIKATPGVSVPKLRSDTSHFGPKLAAPARAMFHRWLSEAGVGQ